MSYSFPGGNGKIVANTRLDISAATVDMGSGTLICSNLEISANAVGVTSSDTSGNQLATLDWVNENVPTIHTVNFDSNGSQVIHFLKDAHITTNNIKARIIGTTPTDGHVDFQSIAFPPPFWVMVGNAISSGDPTIFTSSDGIDWVGVPDSSNIFTTGNDVAWNGEYWVAVGAGDYGIAKSTDGTTWTGVKSGTYTCIGWNGTYWIAGANGHVAKSLNGSNWSDEYDNITSFNVKGIAWGDMDASSVWVAVGNGGKHVFYSTDGETWSDDITFNGVSGTGFDGVNNTGGSANRVAWNGEYFLATGGLYQVQRSYNGKDWYWISSNNPYNYAFVNDVAWNDFHGVWIISGDGNFVLCYRSGDEIVNDSQNYWSGISNTTGAKKIATDGSMSVATGPSETMYYSLNDVSEWSSSTVEGIYPNGVASTEVAGLIKFGLITFDSAGNADISLDNGDISSVVVKCHGFDFTTTMSNVCVAIKG